MEKSRLLDTGLLLSDRTSSSSSSSYYYYRDESLGVLLAGLCVGLLGLILSIIAFFCGCFERRKLSVFSVSLIIVALLQSLSSPVVAMQLMGDYCSLKHCSRLLVVWLASRRAGTVLHLLAALEHILSLKQSPLAARLRSAVWSVPIVITVDLICLLFFDVVDATVAVGTVAMVLTLMICIAACRPSRSSPVQGGSKTVYSVVISAVVTFGATYCPSFVLECMMLNHQLVSARLYDLFLCFTNLRLVQDAYLCRIIGRSAPQEQPQETAMGLENRGLDLEQQYDGGAVPYGEAPRQIPMFK